ncbi:cation:proton antiporter [Marinomonas mediterranea]|uniref:Sodium/hydrogen exchanger n=1 Tax=Marinomonas mediterranea (strain ATCC 700492 / JCM 21426 / NBRC 103028 / MMB-1) TaxID=717774 RepID=F2JU47_MARM1|nr:cation:proton antiporter [Marinomonas mediterranea]ADZ91559.1 sodium/hydrogen exchanger [Marinomonas mediterranea MMB-1]WCN09522.1 cation:proton antiporter [Marinomonas mediterranea]WCN13597.1 cation:proton antiporter [Marinomonas mediterranea]WCN17663.1 cation:proton antiporter [Marinomonas mediterranea MMB-1]
MDVSIVHSFFLIFAGAAVVASIALYTRQPMILAYIALGVLLGPSALSLIDEPKLMDEMSHIGIIFLLFLLGLDMQPSHLINMLKKASWVALASSIAFAALGYLVSTAFGYTQTESIIVGLAMMFSSTIVCIKLLPTTVLHHKHTGELVVGLLLLQDIIAIAVLLVLYSIGSSEDTSDFMRYAKPVLGLPILVGGAFLFVKYVLLKLIAKFDRFHEYIFLVSIGWCLAMAVAAETAGLSAEMGAFIAGVALATSPISQYIATNLKPLRDFFLILFFFSIGASFNLALLGTVIVPAIVLAVSALLIKPTVFRYLLKGLKEDKSTSWEVGFRLGQVSEFSLLIAYLAASIGLIGVEASHVIQATAILSFALSTYVVILNYPNPIAISDRLRKD